MTIPFDTKAHCYICHTKGSFDFYGDYICPECLNEEVGKEKEIDFETDKHYESKI